MNKHLLPLIILTVAGFTFNTSELVPIGLLTGISEDLGLSEPHTALVITIYAWVVALMSLPLMLLFAHADFKKLMMGVISLFVVSHAGTYLSYDFTTLLCSRIGVALAHSIFWSIAPAMAVSVTPDHKRATALSALVAGGGIAFVAGLPLGRILGLIAGWRITFASLGILAFIILMAMWRFFPDIPADQTGKDESRKKMLASLVHCRPLLMIYLITVVMVTGHYMGYSYIEPYMLRDGIAPEAITVILALFGVAGLLGSWMMAKWFTTHRQLIIRAVCLGLPCAMIAVAPASLIGVWGLSAVCLAWGLGITVYNITFQNELVSLFPNDSAVPMSLYSGIFNLGIGGGAFFGGIAVNHGMLPQIGYLGGGVALCAAIYCFLRYIPARRG
jgi:DHA1 family L-arabinose/isopropyl-beta-D-thiogalactopyranoside export protein-like MFS transporter